MTVSKLPSPIHQNSNCPFMALSKRKLVIIIYMSTSKGSTLSYVSICIYGLKFQIRLQGTCFCIAKTFLSVRTTHDDLSKNKA